eukprot:1619066-Amphidinium_carterae.2
MRMYIRDTASVSRSSLHRRTVGGGCVLGGRCAKDGTGDEYFAWGNSNHHGIGTTKLLFSVRAAVFHGSEHWHSYRHGCVCTGIFFLLTGWKEEFCSTLLCAPTLWQAPLEEWPPLLTALFASHALRRAETGFAQGIAVEGHAGRTVGAEGFAPEEDEPPKENAIGASPSSRCSSVNSGSSHARNFQKPRDRQRTQSQQSPETASTCEEFLSGTLPIVSRFTSLANILNKVAVGTMQRHSTHSTLKSTSIHDITLKQLKRLALPSWGDFRNSAQDVYLCSKAGRPGSPLVLFLPPPPTSVTVHCAERLHALHCAHWDVSERSQDLVYE